MLSSIIVVDHCTARSRCRDCRLSFQPELVKRRLRTARLEAQLSEQGNRRLQLCDLLDLSQHLGCARIKKILPSHYYVLASIIFPQQRGREPNRSNTQIESDQREAVQEWA